MLPRHLLVDIYVIETASEDSRVRSPSAIPYLGMSFIVLSVIEMSMMKNANTTKLCLNFGDP